MGKKTKCGKSFKHLKNRISKHSTKILLVLGMLNFFLATIGFIVFQINGKVTMKIEGKESSGSNPEVERTLIYTVTVMIINLLAQLMICIFSIWKGNAFQLLNFGFFSIVNNAVLAYFWAYAGIPEIAGYSLFNDDIEEVSFNVPKAYGWSFSICFIILGILELSLLHLAYKKLCWDTFKIIGSDMHIQTCYQNYEIAKGSWHVLFWFSGIEMATVFFFEKNMSRLIVFIFVAAAYITGLIFGYYALRDEKKKRVQLLILLIPVCILGMFAIHFLRSRNRMYHYTMGRLNSVLSFIFSIFYACNFLITLTYAGRSIRQFGKGIKKLMNKEVAEGTAKFDGQEDEYVKIRANEKQIILNLD